MPGPVAQPYLHDLEFLQDLVENVNDLIQSVRPDGTFAYVNSAWCAALGYSRDEAARLRVFDVIHPGSRPHCQAIFQRVLNGERFDNVESTFVAKDGRLVVVEASVSCRFQDGKPVATRTILRDVTERKQAEETLRIRAKQMEDAQVLAKLGSWVWDIARNHVIWSDQLYHIFGVRPAEFEATFEAYLARVHVEDRPRTRQIIEQAFRDHQPFQFEERIVRPDGEVRYLHSQGEIATDEHGQPLRMTGICQDITERKQSESSLRESEERFRKVWNQAGDGMRLTDANGIVLMANDAYCRLVELPRESVEGHSLAVSQPPDQAERINRRHRERFVSRTVPFQMERELTLWNGQRKWVALTNTMLEGQKPVLLSTFRDISERKQAEEALRLSQARYLSLVETLPVSLFRKDMAGRFTYANQRFCALLGQRFEEIIGKTDFDFFPRDLAEAYRSDDRQVIASNAPLNKEEHNQAPGGETRYVQVIKVPIRDSHGQANGIQAIFWDVTERKRTEQALQASEKRYASLVNNLSSIVWEADAQTFQFRFVSPQAERILGIPVSEWLSEPNFWREHVHPEDRERIVAYCRDCTRRGVDHEFEYRMIAADGRSVWLHDVVSVESVEGAAATLRGVMVDISDRKRAEEERRQLEAQIQHAQKLESLGVLAGGIAHDFNNLLTSVLGYTGLALMQLPDESIAVPLLHEIEKAAQRAADLTQQMLAYSGRGAFVIKTLRLDLLVQEMTKLLGTVISKKAALNLNLEPASIEGDATQVRQVVMNLITNASDALEEKSGIISVRTGAREADAAYLRSPYLPEPLPAGVYAYVEVEDSGCGMSRETLDRIFDPFFTTKFTGRGLGLAAVLGIIKGHRGTIKVDSTPGRGTVFQVLFPYHGSVPGVGQTAAPEGPSTEGHGTILVVEDEPTIRSFTRRVLESSGFRVREAADGREGLDLYGRHRTEIIAVLLDLTMPHMDGIEVLAELRRFAPDLPVLVMSGYSELEVASRFAGMDASGFIQKPFHPRDLIARLHQLLPQQGKPGRQ